MEIALMRHAVMTVLLSTSVGLAFTHVATSASTQTRTEHDLLGDKQVPADAYYGVQTARALENFKISGVTASRYPEFIDAYVLVKLAAARANARVGALKKDRLAAIEKACQAVLSGK